VQNKANSPQASGGASTLWKRSYGTLDMHKVSGKQSQYPAPPGGPGLGGRGPWGVVQTKPIPLEGQERWRQTKPICETPTWEGTG